MIRRESRPGRPGKAGQWFYLPFADEPKTKMKKQTEKTFGIMLVADSPLDSCKILALGRRD
jgi:hypothetical protein